MSTAKVTMDDLASWIDGNPEVASKVVDLMERGRLKDEMLDWLRDEFQEWKNTPKPLPDMLLADDEYLTEFHKQWNEACVEERERTLSMHFSHEYAKAQSRRLESAVWLSEEREGRKQRS